MGRTWGRIGTLAPGSVSALMDEPVLILAQINCRFGVPVGHGRTEETCDCFSAFRRLAVSDLSHDVEWAGRKRHRNNSRLILLDRPRPPRPFS
jgi:hypothetical protein